MSLIKQSLKFDQDEYLIDRGVMLEWTNLLLEEVDDLVVEGRLPAPNHEDLWRPIDIDFWIVAQGPRPDSTNQADDDDLADDDAF